MVAARLLAGSLGMLGVIIDVSLKVLPVPALEVTVRFDMDELRALQSRMDAILRQQGMTRGSVGERMTALGKDSRFAFEESDAGRAKLRQTAPRRTLLSLDHDSG